MQPQTYLISNSSGEVGFNWESHHCLDDRTFEQRICQLLRRLLATLDEVYVAHMEECLTLYPGDLSESLYTDWALVERERFRSLYLTCLVRLMEYHAGRRNFEQSIAYGQEILRRDPLHEQIHRILMRIYLESGQRTLAIRQYDQCRKLLGQELGVPPLDETHTLYQQVVAASHRDGTGRRTSTGPRNRPTAARTPACKAQS